MKCSNYVEELRFFSKSAVKRRDSLISSEEEGRVVGRLRIFFASGQFTYGLVKCSGTNIVMNLKFDAD